jgi:eukaryotic-like serine/threonine-protein kinase
MTPQQYERLTELFHAALEIAPVERAAFLDQVSDGDADLRRELESLLASHEQGTSADGPPDDIAAGYLAQQGGNSASLSLLAANTRLDHYEVRSLLGKGGMGEVYLAEDMRLHRKVALKILPAAVATDQDRMRRFEQEAMAAAALNHPYIAHIYEIGESAGTHFIAIEHIDGDTLRDKIHRDKAPLEKLLKYLTQVAEGLAKAHAAGIVHRDLKPDNIMITRDDYAKILDFGLAKLVETERSLGSAQASEVGTRIMGQQSLAGMVMGTVGYMSPEQAQGKVKEIDQRSDIFSFGCILFEATTGHKPFEGEDILDSLHKIVHAPTPLIKERNANAPDELQRIVRRCLTKDPDERYQTIKDVALELKEVRQGMTGAAVDTSVPSSGNTQTLGHQTTEQSATSTSSAEYIVNQIKSHKRSAAIALAAVVIVAASLAYFFYFRHNRAPALSEQDTILIADFDNKTGEEIFDDTLKLGLAVQLEQSPFWNLFPDTRVRDTLKLMNRSPNERVTTEIGREICQRQGLKALIAGSIAPLGSLYVLTLTAINSTTGEVIAREQIQAEGREQVLKALSQAAIRLREKLGESLNSIQKFAAPKEVTTSSLEALKAYFLGQVLRNSGKEREAIRYLKRAVEIDPNFALAHGALAFSYSNTNQAELAQQSAEKAYALRDQLSESERLTVLDGYYGFVTGEIEKKIENSELRTQLYPRNAGPFMNLSLSYLQIGEYEKAVPEASEALRIAPKSTIAYGHLVHAFTGLNRFAEAKEMIERGLQQNPDLMNFHARLYQLSFVGGDHAGMQQQLDWAKGKSGELVALDWQTAAVSFAGQWRRAESFSRSSIDEALRNDAKEAVAEYLAETALRGAVFDECTRSKAAAVQALALKPHRLLGVRPILALALCGEATKAQQLVDALVKGYPKDTRINDIWAPTIRAAIELERGKAQAAVDLLEGAKRYEAAAQFWPQYFRGQAYLKLGRGAEAAVEFQKILDHRGQSPLSVLYPLAHLGLARAAAVSGDAAKARQAYHEFFALWKDADADLPVLIAAKREYEKLK